MWDPELKALLKLIIIIVDSLTQMLTLIYLVSF